MPHYLPIQWVDGHLRLLDQRELPARVTFIDYVDPRAVAEAITAMVVRGRLPSGSRLPMGWFWLLSVVRGGRSVSYVLIWRPRATICAAHALPR